MDRAWNERRVVEAGGRARRFYTFRILAEQRLHLAAVLIFIVAALPLFAADIGFSPTLTQQDFRTFSRIVGQAIYADPVQPARSSGLLSFDVGVASSLIKVDTSASYWRDSTTHDFSTNGYVAVPRLVVSKGFGSGTVTGMFAKVNNSDIEFYGGSLDLPIIRGTLATPEIALRASYATLTGASVFNESVYGLEACISKGFGPLMPFASAGRMRTSSSGEVRFSLPSYPTIHFKDSSNLNRFTVGIRLSLLVPKIVVEATQAEVRSYAAKISFGW